MTKDEALKLALEALTYLYTETTAYEDDVIDKAITAIKEALAQPEQGPVAWGMRSENGQIYDVICSEEHADCAGAYTVPLYTTPPKRPWVGLTDDENAICLGFNKVLGLQYQEAKLKEKNT